MNFTQNMLQMIEVGKGQSLVRIIPLCAALLVVGIAYDYLNYHGLNDQQSMDNAQLARQIVRGQGFTTEFLRPFAVTQIRDYRISEGILNAKGDLFPAGNSPRVLPDTYNAPGYPYLLAAWFAIVHPEFDQTGTSMGAARIYSGDRWIPPLNQTFMILTVLLVFILGYRLFDERVAWMSAITFLATDLVWHYSVTALSTTFLMFLVTGILMCALEIFCVGEACFEREELSFGPAWVWSLILGVLLALACLTRLNLVILMVPLFIALMMMPRASVGLLIVITLVVLGALAPWFLHMTKVTGNPLGSNMSLLLYGEDEYSGNQVFCTTSIPDYEHLFRETLKKEVLGFRWAFEHFWSLLGSNPMIIFFAASILHSFKRRRTRLFHWLVIISAVFLVAVNNLGDAKPDPFAAWNILIILLPAMIVIGSAIFFIMMDRLNIHIQLLNSIIVVATLGITALPLVQTVTSSSPVMYNYPPYMPPLIKIWGQLTQPNEWITTDMPWATAWYADRPSLWLPDSISDFESFHDNICPSGIMLLTPVSWSQPISNFTTGEYKDWLPCVTRGSLPAEFPLSVFHAPLPGQPDYTVWSDRPRWEAR